MPKLNAFNFVTLNGLLKGPNEDISWHRHGGEESEYSTEMLESGNTLLFGRVTYEMMAGFWSTPAALEAFPAVADGMSRADKVVFSRTLTSVDWNNTRLVNGNVEEEVRAMKAAPGKDMTILGSGSIVSQLADRGLIDEYQIMVDPVALGDGTPLFKGIKNELKLRLTSTRTFGSGIVLLRYQPAVPKQGAGQQSVAAQASR